MSLSHRRRGAEREGRQRSATARANFPSPSPPAAGRDRDMNISWDAGVASQTSPTKRADRISMLHRF
eukprot:3313937-Pyramimonas_sp.AAC.1